LVLVLGSAVAHDRDHGRGHGHGDKDLDRLKAEMAALKDRVRRLEGNLTRAEVAGRYTMMTYQTQLGEDAAGNTTHVEHAVFGAALQLNGDGTFSLSGTELKFTSGWSFPAMRTETNQPDSVTGTWSYAAGVLSLVVGTETIPFAPGAVGGRMFVTVSANFADGTTTQIILIRNP
jgi:hypothetical protein